MSGFFASLYSVASYYFATDSAAGAGASFV